MVYADEGAESLHQVGLETALVDGAVGVLDAASTVSLVLVEVPFIY